jgi:hypothetical protein
MFAFLLAAAVAAAPPSNPCAYDRERLLALDEHAFDQDMQGGWRTLAFKSQCSLVAADLLRDYRAAHHSTSSILLWHEGQLRADAGQTRAAIALFEKSRKGGEDADWNLYVDGTIAFLERDRPGLVTARNSLAALPRPADFKPTGPDGKPLNIAWPPNLNVLDGLLACFGRSYDKAYGNPRCMKPIGQIHLPDR